MKNKKFGDLEKALIKKATGYDAQEVVEEFLSNEETKDICLVKKKCTTRHIPPDITAIKILLSYYDEKTFKDLEKLSDAELLAQRDELISKLEKFEEKEKL